LFLGKQVKWCLGYFLPALPSAMKNGIRSIRFSFVISCCYASSPCNRPTSPRLSISQNKQLLPHGLKY